MSEPIDNGGPAFPQPIDDMGTFRSVTEGMSLRDYFAGESIQNAVVWESQCPTKTEHSEGIPTLKGIARRAYQLADAMLAERNKQP